MGTVSLSRSELDDRLAVPFDALVTGARIRVPEGGLPVAADEVRVRDPVHNFISLRDKELALLNTPVMQRLRGIRQLAMANLVYPGALHTRFDHSLGVMHIAGLMAEALPLSKDEVDLVRHAALLHDVGHGPFSHVSEHALERYADRSKLRPDQKRGKIHEIVTAKIIESDPEIVAILGEQDCRKVTKLLGEGRGQPALRSIVSGPLDADKQDYLLRDSYFCGVPYGVFDMGQMHRSLVLRGPEGDKEIMVDPNAIHSVEQYVLAKYYLTCNVYSHKVRLITDQMIVRAIVLGIEKDDNKELRKLYAFDNTEEFVKAYSEWDDARFMHEFCLAAKPSRCKDMLDRLRLRRLLKRVFSLETKTKEFPPEVVDTLKKIGKGENRELRQQLEARFASELEKVCHGRVDPDEVIFHFFSRRSVRVVSRNDEKGIMIAREPKPVFFEQESPLFASIDPSYSEEFVEVYAPLAWDTKTARNRAIGKAEGPIKKAIEELCLGDAEEGSSDGCG